MESMYQSEVEIKQLKKNKFAITSLVLSIVSLMASVLLIPQLLGIIFGCLGLGSKKKGFAVAGIIISVFAFFIAAIVFAISIPNIMQSVDRSRIAVDELRGSEISDAIVSYISESNDVELKFGKNETASVRDVIENLQEGITINDKTYGPYLDEATKYDGETAFRYEPHNGWEIIIDLKDSTLYVLPSEEGDAVIIEGMDEITERDPAF
jgi:hypothetical protein